MTTALSLINKLRMCDDLEKEIRIEPFDNGCKNFLVAECDDFIRLYGYNDEDFEPPKEES